MGSTPTSSTMTPTINRLPKSTVEITVKIPWKEVEPLYEREMAKALAGLTVPGFRKGKAPRKKAEAALDKAKILEEAAAEIIPKAYQEAVAKHQLKPIAQPKAQLNKLAADNDWEIKFILAEKPEIKLGDWKEKIKGASAKDKIWVPGKDRPDASGETQHKTGKIETEEQKRGRKLNKAIEILMETSEVEIADLLVESEANRALAKLVDDVQAMGLTVDQYLNSTQKTAEDLKAQYAKAAIDQLKLDFILNEIADLEKISVEQAEIERTIQEAAKVEAEKTKEGVEEIKKRIRAQSYALASILRKQKTIDYLLGL